MNDVTMRMDEIGKIQVRNNPSYSSGILVNAGDVIAEFSQSPWIRSTTSLNLYDKDAWAERVKACKVGFAVVYKSPEGADYRTVLNPKASWAGVANNAGKDQALNPGLATGELIEAELNFAAGKTVMPTIVAGRTTKQPGGGTLTPTATNVEPAIVGANGITVDPPLTLGLTSQGTNNKTGTTMVPNGVVQTAKPNTAKTINNLKGPIGKDPTLFSFPLH